MSQSFPMPVTILGASTFTNDGGTTYNSVFVSNTDENNANVKGALPAKHGADSIAFSSLPSDPSMYPLSCTALATTRTSQGKTAIHFVGFQDIPGQKASQSGKGA